MQTYQKAFIDLSLNNEVLKFGSFKLKSGRISPYFFNAGLFCTGEAMHTLAKCYAQSIMDNGIKFDVIFGPAYKGIPLSAAIAMELYSQHDINVGYAYNRKEAKDHGEGGVLVGADMTHKKVLIVDDVITAGTAIVQSLGLLQESNATIVGVSLALDRQEKGLTSEKSAIQEIQAKHGFPILSIISMKNIMDYVGNNQAYQEYMPKFSAYREQYGVKD
jgi:orotate phosphoribosyltransferase